MLTAGWTRPRVPGAAVAVQDTEACAALLMDNWTMPPALYGKVPPMADLDSTFLRDIADVRSLVLNSSEILDEMRTRMQAYFAKNDEGLLAKGRRARTHAASFHDRRIDVRSACGKGGYSHTGKGHTRQLVRAILALGGGLRLEREFRDILIDLVRARAGGYQRSNRRVPPCLTLAYGRKHTHKITRLRVLRKKRWWMQPAKYIGRPKSWKPSWTACSLRLPAWIPPTWPHATAFCRRWNAFWPLCAA